MPDDLKIRVSAPGADEAERDLLGVASAEERVGRAGKRAGEGLRETARAGGRLRGIFTSILGALGVGAGIEGVIGRIRDMVQDWERSMDRIARASREAGENMVAFAMMQEPGTGGERARAAARLGAEFGVGPGEAWRTVQAMHSQLGGFEQGMAGARAAWQLRRAGVPGESAAAAVSVGAGLGMTPREAAAAVYAAGEASSLSPAEMAQAATMGLPGYRGIGGGPTFGYGVMAALSRVIKEPGQLGTYASQAARALSAEEGKVGKLWRRLGVEAPGARPMEQLRALAGAGITTEQELTRAGFGEIRQRRALSILLADLAATEATVGRVRERAVPGVLEEAYARAAGESPEIRYAQKVAELEAMLQGVRTFGPHAEAAREMEIKERLAGLYLEATGRGDLTDEEGKPGFLASLWYAPRSVPAKYWEIKLRELGTLPGAAGGVHYHGVYEDPAGARPRQPNR